MNSNDFDSWIREAILRAALEYRDSSEKYRSELVYTELARVTAERDRLRELLNYAVEWTRDRGYDDPETAPEWFLSALKEASDE